MSEHDDVLRAAKHRRRRAPAELARVMGTSVAMIEHHYGALVDGAQQGILDRLDRAAEAPEAGRSRR